MRCHRLEPTKLPVVPTVERSGFPLILRLAARGSADPAAVAVFDVRLLPMDGDNPLTVGWRFVKNVGLVVLLPEESRVRARVPFFTPVPGGSGSGLVGADVMFDRFVGVNVVCGRGRGGLTPVINSWFIASSGVNRRAGSHRRQRATKFRNGSSSHLSTCLRSFELGRRRLPFEDTVILGLPKESKNNFLRVLFSIRCFSGGPNTSMIQANCSCSFWPGNIG